MGLTVCADIYIFRPRSRVQIEMQHLTLGDTQSRTVSSTFVLGTVATSIQHCIKRFVPCSGVWKAQQIQELPNSEILTFALTDFLDHSVTVITNLRSPTNRFSHKV